MEHLFHGNKKCVLVTENDHPKRIADKDGVDSGLVHCQGGGIVIGSEHGDDLTTFLLLTIGKRSYLLAHCRRAGGNGYRCRHGILQNGRSRLVWQSLFLPQLDSFDVMPSRSRKADTRGASIIPQNSNFIYNKFIKNLMSLRACFSRRSNLRAN